MLIETPFNYTGSKFKLLDQLFPHFDYEKNRLVDLFCGGGSVYANSLDKFTAVAANDIIGDLVGIHQAIVNNDEIIEDVQRLCVSKTDSAGYQKLRLNYNTAPTPAKLYALMLCCTNNMMRFNRKFQFNQTFGKRTFNKKTDEKLTAFKNHVRSHAEKLAFSVGRFDAFACTTDDFVYIDPPYSNTEAGYNSYWNKVDDLTLFAYCKQLDALGASFMVSGVEHHDGAQCRLLELLMEAGFTKVALNFNYNKVSRKGDKNTSEIIIKNY